MHSRKPIAALALAAGLMAPAALATTPAHAMAASCRVTLYDIDAGNVAEGDGQDELRFLVQGNLFPRFNSTHYSMRSGDDGDPADFEYPTAIITTGQNVTFDLREADGPIWGQGTSLGTVTAFGSSCVPLDEDEDVIISDTLTGDEPTEFTYSVRLKMVGL
ncbi:hypothetical protein [Nonomuraea jiangxiensis]|uniref:Allene oxide cyclase barrel-like domain-containing protein n=1 Tax=Nonomuraea jiangxiensis TaxID=633440 RepID=A0A1G9IF83_9ACTN|nr:hypothetical protein [Nonomuraea jiangxiensis]SDL23503.1 hypothetical protein SAMN05421869_123162 [Nonomuraea jiangxiensis]